MENINRLRRYVECHDKITGLTATCINHFIDSIDKEVDDMWHALTIDAKPMTDENMAADGWVRLPVDADGVPIHVGDVMEWVDEPGITRTVTSIQLANDGWWVYISGTGRRPDKYRHHHAPTVEDVLRKFTDEVWNRCCEGATASDSGIDGLVAEYAARLRLAGDE